MMLDADTLCRSDATCRLLRQLNRANAGPWRALGGRMFHGMELEHEGIFESAEEARSIFDVVKNHRGKGIAFFFLVKLNMAMFKIV